MRWSINIATLLIILTPALAWGQSQALYNLRNVVPQNAQFNAAFIPQGRTVVGLPIISGISVGINSATNYNTLITKNDEGQLIIDFDNMIQDMDEKSFNHVNATISDLYLGFQLRNAFVSFFINERVNVDAHTPKSMLKLAWEGNTATAGRFFDFEKFGFDAKYYREIGIGYAKPINNQLTVGTRLKLLQGIFVGRTDRNFSTRIRTRQETFELDFDVDNAVYNMAGKSILDDGDVASMISNGSKGIALDLGMEYQMTDLAYLSIGINDLGFINWKEDAENFELQSSSFEWNGVNLKTVDDFGDEVKDSLLNRFDRIETTDNFITGVNAKTYISAFFHPTYQDVINVTLSSRFVLGRIQTSLGAGINHHFGKRFILGANAVLTPQQGFDFGSAMALNLGPVQLYAAYDHLLGLSNVTKLNAAQFSFGMNLIFGRSLKKSKDPRQAIIDRNNEAYPDYPATQGVYTPVIREEGIYQIIKEKKEPTPRRSKPSAKERSAEDTGYMPVYKQPKRKNRGDFNPESDERGISRYFFWNNWFHKN